MDGLVIARTFRFAPVAARLMVMPLVIGPMSSSVSALTNISVETDWPVPPPPPPVVVEDSGSDADFALAVAIVDFRKTMRSTLYLIERPEMVSV